MIILHPYGDTRKEDQQETWDFLKAAESLGYEVIHRNVTGKWVYVDFVKEFWGRKTITIVEDDKVPILADLDEMTRCSRTYCCFPFPINFQLRTGLAQWNERFPYTTGFVKFDLSIQKALPVEKWGPFFYAKESRPSIDRAIEEPLIKKFGPMHVHQRMIKHNHKPTLKILTKQYGAKLLARIS